MVSEGEQLERIAEIAQELADTEDLDGLLQRVVDLGEAYLDGCDGVSLMLIRKGGKVSTPAFSSLVARDSDLAQYETNEGPCLEAIRERKTVLIDDLETEQRWPDYRQRALRLGVRSMVSFRLFVRGDTMGALDFYGAAPQAFGALSQLYGRVFASHASVAMKAAIAETGLVAALESRDVIGQAKGVLMERRGMTGIEAFDYLQQLSQHRNRSVRALAQEITRTGEIPTAHGNQ